MIAAGVIEYINSRKMIDALKRARDSVDKTSGAYPSRSITSRKTLPPAFSLAFVFGHCTGRPGYQRVVLSAGGLVQQLEPDLRHKAPWLRFVDT